MMLALSRRTLRRSWPPYAGAFVALACGITLIATTVDLIAAVDRTLHSDVPASERQRLEDLSALLGTMSGVALFMAVFVVASTFGFVVAARQRELGLLRLVGATPRQVRVMVLGEAAAVAVLAAVAGALLESAATPVLVRVLRAQGLLGGDLDQPAPWLAWSIGAGAGAVVALLGAWRASKRASRVPPAAALREAGLERRRPGVLQAIVGTACLAGPVVLFALVGDVSPLFALVTAILLPEVVVVGLICFGRLIFPWLAGLLARPFVRHDVAARLARDHVRTGARTPAALAAPIVAISAVAGSMIVALSFTADWTTALNRAQLQTPLVVETHGDRRVAPLLAGDPDVAVADPRVVVGEHEVVDVRLAVRARGLHAVRGSLDGLGPDHVAVTETYAADSGHGLGDRVRVRVDGETRRPTVAAVVRDAPDLYGDVLLPTELGGRRAARAVPEVVFVDPGAADVEALLAGTDAEVLPVGTWLAAMDDRTREGNELGLWVLLGPAGLYAGIAIVNAVLIGVGQRRAQLRTVALLGATDDQLRRMAVWEAGLVGAAALLTGGAVTAVVGAVTAHAITHDVAGVSLTVPWLPLLAVTALCVGLALLAALVGSARLRRPA